MRSGLRLPEKLRDTLAEEIVGIFLECSETILCVSWGGEIPGGDGAIYLRAVQGVYVYSGSDYEPWGPYVTLDDAMGQERLRIRLNEPCIDSDSLPLSLLLTVARDVGGDDESVWVNGVEYTVKNGVCRTVADP